MELPSRAQLEALAAEAGTIALGHFRRAVAERKADRSLVTAADRAVEAHLAEALATLLPDGAPHATETWIDTDGSHVLLNTIVGYQKQRNLERDPRIALLRTQAKPAVRVRVSMAGEAKQ